MEKFYDLTGFDVVRSDNGETYCVLEKYFDTGEEALEFVSKMRQDIYKAIKEGNMKFHGFCSDYPYACGYLPMVNFKLPSCNGYDDYGNYDEAEDEGIFSDFEMTCCIMNSSSYQDGRVELTLYFVALPDDIDDVKIKEIEIYGSTFI